MIKKKILQFAFIGLALSFISFCGSGRNALRDHDNLTVVSANQEISMGLKDRCRPVALLLQANDQQVLLEVIEQKADTVQVFQIHGGDYYSDSLKDVRLWQCSAIQEKPAVRVALKTKNANSKASVFIADFINQVSVRPENYQWLQGSVPLAVDAAMDDLFQYEKTDRNRLQPVFSSVLAGNHEPNSGAIEQLAAEHNVDIIIFGRYALNEQATKLVISSEILFIATGKRSETLKIESALDGTMFDSIRLLTEKITKRIYQEELRRR